MPIEVARELAAPPAAAWRLLTDTRAWPRWGPTITAVEADRPVIGLATRGRVRTSVGVWAPFEITGFVPGSSWHWRVAGIPATGHRVEPAARGCRVVFEVPWPAAPYVIVCRIALGRLAAMLEEPAG